MTWGKQIENPGERAKGQSEGGGFGSEHHAHTVSLPEEQLVLGDLAMRLDAWPSSHSRVIWHLLSGA
eukprot:6261776-Amphidinium_carterae.1